MSNVAHVVVHGAKKTIHRSNTRLWVFANNSLEQSLIIWLNDSDKLSQKVKRS